MVQEALQDLVHTTVVNTRRFLKEHDLADSVPNNVQHFLTIPVKQWFLTCGELCVSNGPDASQKTNTPSAVPGLWSEDRHQDGGMSVLHMGLILYGRRRLVMEQGDGDREPTIWGCPGLSEFWLTPDSTSADTRQVRKLQYGTLPHPL